MSLLFLPTFAVFGVSISIVFLSLLVNLPKIEEKEGLSEAAITQPDGCANDVTTAITKGERNSNEQTTCYDFKVTTICINESTRRT
ncbi:MAG: hypothetical protein Q8O99_02205 [bacterium]|nr:hypothetical protein [bacterium]